LADPHDPVFAQKRWGKMAVRAGRPLEEFMGLVHQVWARREEVPNQIRAVAAKARARGLPMLSHDDTQSETRQFYRSVGATVSEFPMTMDPVQDARGAGDALIFGSPNVVRGGSHIGSLSAADMVEAGLWDALASDYYYPAMLAAVERLDREKRKDRLSLWSLVSSGPARAMGLSDRGEIAVGKRADLVVVDWPDTGPPAVQSTWVAGRAAYQAQPFII
ncbi:MAG: amidohydrolase family protein, partial [Pseudomonadota bacterium]